MKTPLRITASEFIKEKARFTTEDTRHSEYGVQVCKKCGSFIHYVLAYLEIHSITSECNINSGETIAEEIGYCPECEEVPQEKGCVHV